MTTFARVVEGVVVDVARVDPHTIFRTGYADEFVTCPDGVEVGWVTDGDNWQAPDTGGA